MADAITAEIFDHLVELAALELQPAEAEYLRAQLNSQLPDDVEQGIGRNRGRRLGEIGLHADSVSACGPGGKGG